jgi:predicted MPP superfamily phosphohydrolase
LDALGIQLLQNEVCELDGITWVGVDSANEGYAEPVDTMALASGSNPILCLWHEPDFVDLLPPGAALMMSGHSHGGQWRFPWGWTPMHTKGGTRYVDGFYPEASTPLYVSRGVGTTGPPARMGALAEVAILDLYHDG